MMTLLEKIIKRKEIEVLELKSNIDDIKEKIDLMPKPRDFKRAITKAKEDEIAVIAEIKRKSPSEGLITGIDPVEIAKKYEKSDASAISVLTNSDFDGNIELIPMVKECTILPILRKEFIIDVDQIYESRAYGSDAILLIASILESDQLERFFLTAKKLGMACLVECHTREDIDKVPSAVEIYGINNRDLEHPGFKTDIGATKELIGEIPGGKIIVSESGICKENIDQLRHLDRRVHAVLVGTNILKSDDSIGYIKDLVSARSGNV